MFDATSAQGEVVSFDAYHKRVKLRYDDGHQEWVAPQKEQFRWLLPRAASAGCTASMAQLMADLGAKGVPPAPAHETPERG